MRIGHWMVASMALARHLTADLGNNIKPFDFDMGVHYCIWIVWVMKDMFNSGSRWWEKRWIVRWRFERRWVFNWRRFERSIFNWKNLVHEFSFCCSFDHPPDLQNYGPQILDLQLVCHLADYVPSASCLLI